MRTVAIPAFEQLVADGLFGVIPCEWYGHGEMCEKLATWTLRCYACGQAYFWCDAHRAMIDLDAAEPGGISDEHPCDAPWPAPLPWRAV